MSAPIRQRCHRGITPLVGSLLACLAPAMSGVVACSRQGSEVALGSVHETPQWAGECNPTTISDSAVLQERNGYLTAAAVGRASIVCTERTLRYQVREAVALKIELSGPAALAVGQTFRAELHATDADGAELEVGTGSDITWSRSPGLYSRHRCDHMMGVCITRTDWSLLRADAPGPQWVEVSFGSLDARLDFTVGSPDSAGGSVDAR